MRPVWRVHDRVVRRGDPGVAVDARSDARIRGGATVRQGQRYSRWPNGGAYGPEAAQADDDVGNDGLRERPAATRSQPAGRVRGPEGAEPESAGAGQRDGREAARGGRPSQSVDAVAHEV